MTGEVSAAPSTHAMPDTVGLNFFDASPVLGPIIDRWVAEPARTRAIQRCTELGLAASTELERAAALCDRHPPQLHVRDRTGEPANRLEFHPAWDELVDAAYRRFRISALSHEGVPGRDRVPEVAKQALFFLLAHADLSICTGVSMTDVLGRVLRMYAPELAARYVPRLTDPVSRRGSPRTGREGDALNRAGLT